MAMNLHKMMFTLATVFLIANCSQSYTVTDAPHRKAVTDKVPGLVQHSHPVKVSKNSGVGQTVGGLGGVVAGTAVGAGTGRFVGVVIGRFIVAQGGGKVETHYRQKDAQEVMVKIKGVSHKLISLGEQQYKTGDKIWADTNVYGEPITITPR
jgi:outer membrane lipoprotein SlyB